MSAQAAAVVDDTAPELNPWLQPVSKASPDIAAFGKGITARVSRVLDRPQDAPATGVATSALNGRATTTRAEANELMRENINRSMAALLHPPIERPVLSLQPLQEWEGYVVEISETKFSARLTDITAKKTSEDELADFPVDDLSDDDRTLLQVGAVFRWVIGYQRSVGGTKRRVSQITFRRLPAWTRREIQQAKAKAEELHKEIVWD